MAKGSDKKIQIKRFNGTNWDYLYPVTKIGYISGMPDLGSTANKMILTTDNGALKLPEFNAGGFVKISAAGVISVDQTNYSTFTGYSSTTKLSTDYISGLATVATSGSYTNLDDKPTIGDATLTVTVNGTSKGTFTANATSNATIALTAADFGLTSVLKLVGTNESSNITDGGHELPTGISGYTVYTDFHNGDVVRQGNKEFVMTGVDLSKTLGTSSGQSHYSAKWEEIGDEGSYALKTVSISAGTGLTGGGTLAESRTLSLATSGVSANSYGPSSSASLNLSGGTFTVPYITVDTYGRITAASNKTMTMPTFSVTSDVVEAVQGTVPNKGIAISSSNGVNTLSAFAIMPASNDSVDSIGTSSGVVNGMWVFQEVA